MDPLGTIGRKPLNDSGNLECFWFWTEILDKKVIIRIANDGFKKETLTSQKICDQLPGISSSSPHPILKLVTCPLWHVRGTRIIYLNIDGMYFEEPPAT